MRSSRFRVAINNCSLDADQFCFYLFFFFCFKLQFILEHHSSIKYLQFVISQLWRTLSLVAQHFFLFFFFFHKLKSILSIRALCPWALVLFLFLNITKLTFHSDYRRLLTANEVTPFVLISISPPHFVICLFYSDFVYLFNTSIHTIRVV